MPSQHTTLFFDRAQLGAALCRDVRIGIDGGRIVRVETGAAPEPGDERHAIGLPGMPNVHSHAFQRGMAGLAERSGPSTDTFWTWRETMYRFALSMTPDDVEALAAQAYVEMLESGFTRVGEFHYLHHDRDGRPYADPAEMAARIVAAAKETGIGLPLLPSFYAHATFGGAPPHDGQRRFVCDLDLFQRLLEASRRHAAALEGSHVGVAPHSLRAVTPGELAAVAAMAGDGPVHIHAAEQVREVADCIAWSGRRPVEWLLDRAGADRRWCLIHATHMTPEETARLAASGAVAGLCPVTEANLGDGIFPTREVFAAAGRIAIGTDSNVLIGVAAELRQLEYAQRLLHRERNVVTRPLQSTGEVLHGATLAGGNQALGEAACGLEAGARADIVSLDPDHLAFAGCTDEALLDRWIFAARTSVVDCVWAGGRKVVARGLHRNRARIAQRYRLVMRRLLG